jgi:hypothetical protein
MTFAISSTKLALEAPPLKIILHQLHQNRRDLVVCLHLQNMSIRHQNM